MPIDILDSDIIDSATGDVIETNIETVYAAQHAMDAIQRHARVPMHLKEQS